MVAAETSGNSPKGRTLAQMLALLVLSILLPAAFLTGTLIWRVGGLDRENANQQALQLARSVAGNLDREIEGSIETLLALSTSPALLRGDFETFHRQSIETMAFRKQNVYVKSIDGSQLMNTRVPWGGPLPALPPTEHDLEIIRTAQPAVSGLVIGAIINRWVVGLGVPVLVGAKVRYILAMSIETEHFRRIVAATPRGPGWIIAVSDRTGRLIARSEDQADYIGREMHPDVRSWSTGPEGVHRTSSLAGAEVMRGYKWSAQTGWLSAAFIPSEIIDAPLRNMWQFFVLFGVGLAAVALPLSYTLSQQITRPIAAATAAADRLGKAEPIEVVQSRLLEANALLSAQANAATELRERTRALVENETRFRSVFEQSAVGFKQVARDGRLLGINDRLCKMLGYTREECLAEKFRVQTHAEDQTADLELVAKLQSGKLPSYELEKRLITKSGDPIWVRVTASMVRDEDGQPLYRLSLVEDVTERRMAREAAARLASIVQVSPDAMISTSLSGNIETWNPGAETLFGYSVNEVVGKPLSVIASADRMGEFKTNLAAALRGETVQIETIRAHKDGTLIEVSLSAVPITTNGRITSISVTMEDIRERKRRENHILLLNRELAHRVKNTLAVIQSIANQTMRSTPDPEKFRIAFQGRLQALAGANDLLMQTNWDGAEAKDFIEKQLGALMPRNSVQLHKEGPRVIIPSELSIPLGLALHELGTNAIKYGAWSVPGGQVRLHWAFKDSEEEGRQRLVFTWTEQGGPVVHAPQRSGFGTTLIERGVPGANVERRFLPGGLVCVIDLELAA